MTAARSILVVVLATMLFTACSVFKSTTDSSASKEEAAQEKEEDDDPFKPWDKTLEDTERIDGFLPLHRKADGTLYAELPADQLRETFGLVMHISQGAGVFNLHDGLPLSDTRLMQFRRVGHEVYLVHRNPRFRADEGPMRTSLEDNTAHSVVQSFDIVSRNDSTNHLLIDLTDFLVSDYASVGERLQPYFNGQPARLESGKSHVERVMGFPDNVEIDASLTYEGSSPPLIGGEAVPDYRSVSVGVRYSLFRLPEEPMQRRLADDRVGYFSNAIKDFSRDQQDNPYVPFVQRWRLAPADTAAYRRGELVPPVEPIVYYIDRTVPERYRRYVREGIEAWNEAFRHAGYENAVVAKTAPDDSTWSAEDIRYSTVRWTAAHQMGYAIGPSQTDPRTGEILNADILISSSFVRGWKETHDNLFPETNGGSTAILSARSKSGSTRSRGVEPSNDVLPSREAPLKRTPAALREMFPPRLARQACWAEHGKAQQLGLQRAVLSARGALAPDGSMPEEYLGAAIRDLVMHEVGHTLGLRHNFKASSGIPTDKLHDEDYTRTHGVSLSVMDYAPVNIAPDPNEQGHYWNPSVGTYDEWAIRYGYMPIAQQSGNGPLVRDAPLADTMTTERAGLNKIAAKSSDPMHRYGTDEDNWLGAYAVDPLTNAWELGADPAAFAETRTELIEAVKPKLDDRLVQEGDRYHRLREATTTLLLEQYQSLLPVTKTLGGMYVSRDHKGTPDARMPFRPVSADEQEEALQLLVESAFAPDAFQFDAQRLNKLAPERYAHWGASQSLRLDYPVHDMVDVVHSGLLGELLHPARLQRMIDNRTRADEAYGPGALLQHLSDAIWSELGTAGPINSFRRNLQRTYTDRLIELMLDTTTWITITLSGADQLGAPEDVRSLARLELRELSGRMDDVLAEHTLDRETRAHLSETQVRIERALDASLDLTTP